jgi:hypothetical protein
MIIFLSPATEYAAECCRVGVLLVLGGSAWSVQTLAVGTRCLRIIVLNLWAMT